MLKPRFCVFLFERCSCILGPVCWKQHFLHYHRNGKHFLEPFNCNRAFRLQSVSGKSLEFSLLKSQGKQVVPRQVAVYAMDKRSLSGGCMPQKCWCCPFQADHLATEVARAASTPERTKSSTRPLCHSHKEKAFVGSFVKRWRGNTQRASTPKSSQSSRETFGPLRCCQKVRTCER